MYDDWASYTVQLSSLGETNRSVLVKLPAEDALRVVNCVAKTLASQLGLQSQDAKPSTLSREEEITWFMEVICYGLSLPLSEHDTVKDCVNVYCEWLSALLPGEPKSCVPSPIVEESNRFARKIIQHLFHLFVPRKGGAQETIGRQAVLCHRVLRRIQDVVQQSKTIDRETWETLLGFLLAINDALLAPPTVKDDVGDQLSGRVLGVLYEIWLVACVKCFPSPSLWKTFREMAMNWRHRIGLVDQWNRVTMILTRKLVLFMYGPDFLGGDISIGSSKGGRDDDGYALLPEMSDECVAQTWYSFLHSMGNPVDLSRPAQVSATQHFLQYACISSSVIDPTHHPCLTALPEIFLRAMKGLSATVDSFLGYCNEDAGNDRKLNPKRPRCNSILHLLGTWLLEASLIGSEHLTCPVRKGGNEDLSGTIPMSANAFISQPNTNIVDIHQHNLHANTTHTTTSKLGIFRKTSQAQVSSTSVHPTSSATLPAATDSGLDLPDSLAPNRFESGRAEAIGALCRIFCSKKTEETISPLYLARFYVSLHEGLQVNDRIVTEVIAKILLNSKNLLFVDLDGVNTILPQLLGALETVLPNQDVTMMRQDSTMSNKSSSSLSGSIGGANVPTVSGVELRSAAIHMLGSILPFPSHFENLPIKEIIPRKKELDNTTNGDITFADLQIRVLDLLFNAIRVESESKNVQHLLAGLMFLVLDFAKREENNDMSGQNTAETRDIQGPGKDSARVVFVNATHLVCHRLIASWCTDLNTSLAALELLAGLARTSIPRRGALECKRTVKWLCDFVVQQCNRPPREHSKDLHSSIVAAFFCCRTWILHHPYLLQDKECIGTVMEVIELGISGSKSAPKVSSSESGTFSQSSGGKMKEEKILSPASRRVKDAAESLLITLLEQVDQMPLLRNMGKCQLPNGLHSKSTLSVEETDCYRYFVIDNSIVLGMLEEPVSNEQNPQPMVSVILRCASDKSFWTMQLRHLPRHKSQTSNKSPYQGPGRPLAMEETSIRSVGQPSFFPDTVDKIPLCNADKSIPAVESVALDERSISDLEDLSRIVEEQSAREIAMQQGLVNGGSGENANNNWNYGNDHMEGTECEPPEPCKEFQTARLVLAHLGFFTPAALRENLNHLGSTGPLPRIVLLESDSEEFSKDIEQLDSLSTKTVDNIYIYYVRNGQKQAEEILQNMQPKNIQSSKSQRLHPHFIEFLSSLGKPFNNTSETNAGSTLSPGNSVGFSQDMRRALYWEDASSEIMFYVPSLGKQESSSNIDETNADYDYDSAKHKLGPNIGDQQIPNPNRHHLARQFSSGSSTSSSLPEVRVLIVWLESYEDYQTFPTESIVSGINASVNHGNNTASTYFYSSGNIQLQSKDVIKDTYTIFIHELKCGLLRINVKSHGNRTIASSPLVDGMIVSRRALGPLVRQTSLNVASRKRLEQENYQPSHVRRKIKIQELAHKYRCPMSTADFYANLL